LEELKQNEQIQTPKTKKTDEFHLKQITIIALAIFITFCCCILFFFVIYRYNGFTDFWKKLTYILQPVIIGLVVAYLLNPLMKLIDGKLFSLFKGKMKSEKKAKKISRGMAIAGALLYENVYPYHFIPLRSGSRSIMLLACSSICISLFIASKFASK